MADNRRYPALMLDWLTPVYDLFARVFFPEKRFKRELITRACIAPGHHVLDLEGGLLGFTDHVGSLRGSTTRSNQAAGLGSVDRRATFTGIHICDIRGAICAISTEEARVFR